MNQDQKPSTPTPRIDPQIILDGLDELDVNAQIEALEKVHQELTMQLNRAQA
ncbi:hypothetical protein JOD55_001150 [Arcanobacterium pluranimalium]|uniref:hypothetical protein n=1 Tax=Arcanobacterium pluranimalium TaxID=108028 RepID=UPI001957722C|nr:hypothetical protein [Arcanobacterium pluranimalium]MBM7825323.1 hypothetical protein [Arcanobacterium pluranimalium]